MIQLGVEIVQERHRRVAGLLPVDVEAGEDEREKQASGLARGGLVGCIPAVKQQLDGVAVGAGKAPSGGALTAKKGAELLGEGGALGVLGLGAGGPYEDLVALTRGRVAEAERGRKPGGVCGSTKAQPGAGFDEPLGPDGEVRGIVLQSGVSLAEDALEGSGVGSVCRPESRSRTIEKLASLPHGAVDDPKAVGRVDDDLEAPLILAGHHVASIHTKLPPARLQMHLQGAEVAVFSSVGGGSKAMRAVPDDRRGVFCAERTPPGDEPHGFEE